MKQYLLLLISLFLLACSDNSMTGTTSDVDIELAYFQGVVADSANLPIAEAQVNLYRGVDTVVLQSTTTNSAGLYQFSEVSLGEYRVLAEAGDSLAGVLQGIAIDTFIDSIVLLDTITLIAPGTISGSIERYDGVGIVWVYIPGTSYIATVNSLGNFVMTGVAPDSSYTVVFEQYGYSPVSIANVLVTSGDTTLLEPQSLTPNMYPRNVSALYDTAQNIVTLSWDAMEREDIGGYVVSRKDSLKTAILPELLHDTLIPVTTYEDTLHDTLFSQGDTLVLQYQVQGVTTPFGERTGYSVPVYCEVLIIRDSADYQSIAMVSPKKSDTLTGMEEFSLYWNYTGLIDSVELFLTLDGGGSWNPISGVIENKGHYMWKNITNAESPNCQLKVVNAHNSSVLGVTEQFTLEMTPVENLFNNGDFSNGYESWFMNIHHYDTLIKATADVDSGALHFDITSAIPDEAWKINFHQFPSTPLYEHYTYELTFRAKATVPKRLDITVQTADQIPTVYGMVTTNITEEWEEFRLTLKLNDDPSNVEAGVVFIIGDNVSEFWIDDVQMKIAGLR